MKNSSSWFFFPFSPSLEISGRCWLTDQSTWTPFRSRNLSLPMPLLLTAATRFVLRFSHINWFHSLNNPKRKELLLSCFYRWKNCLVSLFCQYYITVSPGSLSWAPRCVASYKRLFSLTFPPETYPPSPTPTMEYFLLFLTDGFFLFTSPLSPKMCLFITSPTSLKLPLFPPIHTFNWPQVALQLLEHMWAMQQFHFPFHSRPSCACLWGLCWP